MMFGLKKDVYHFPDEIINVERPNRIVVKYEDEDKKDHKIKLDGMAVRVFYTNLTI